MSVNTGMSQGLKIWGLGQVVTWEPKIWRDVYVFLSPRFRHPCWIVLSLSNECYLLPESKKIEIVGEVFDLPAYYQPANMNQIPIIFSRLDVLFWTYLRHKCPWWIKYLYLFFWNKTIELRWNNLASSHPLNLLFFLCFGYLLLWNVLYCCM